MDWSEMSYNRPVLSQSQRLRIETENEFMLDEHSEYEELFAEYIDLRSIENEFNRLLQEIDNRKE